MKLISQAAVLAGLLVASAVAVGCAGRATNGVNGEEPTGSMRMRLQIGDVDVSSVTAVISGANGFTQTHSVELTSDVVSILFGSLPVGSYTVQLSAGPCSGASSFDIVASETSLVPVTLYCGNALSDAGTAGGTGDAVIVGTLVPGNPPAACDHIVQLVATPPVQDGEGVNSSVELLLEPGVTPTLISWSLSGASSGVGTVGALVGAADRQIAFDCAANGSVSLIARVTAYEGSTVCVDEGRVAIECINQSPIVTPFCGDGSINQAHEECDGSTLPGSALPGSSCSPSCSIVVPLGACGACALESCALQRNDVDTNLAAVDPIIACVLGADWKAGNRAAASSCANSDLLTCYCGTTAGQDCANAAPAALDGQCVAEVLAGTGCGASSCVAPIFLNPANSNGKAMQYIQCRQDFCYDDCFNP